MPIRTNTPNTQIVTINSVDLPPIEMGGERVVTLAMIDAVHERPDGTARKRLNDNRKRFVEGKHFHKMSASVFRTRFPGLLSERATEDVTFITQQGYLKLVKSFTDDLAWDVQDMLVESYFTKTATAKIAPTPAVTTAVAREVRLTNAWLVGLAKASGVTGNQALIAASQGTERMTGVNPLGLMGITHLPAPQNENLLSPRDIAHRIGGNASDRAVNITLTRIGLQAFHRNHKGKIQYEPTQEGIEASGGMQDTGRLHASGAPVRQLRWASSVVHIVEDAMHHEDAA